MSFFFSRRHAGSQFYFRRLLVAVCFLSFCWGPSNPLEAQRRIQPRPIPYSELEREEGELRLAEMRQMGIEGVYSFLFELRVMPRRGEDRRLTGQLWGSRNLAGPVFRYEFRSSDGDDDRVLRFLVQNGFAPSIWSYDTAADGPEVQQLGLEELFTEIQDTDFTAFDLQMPYIFWPDFAYEGLSRVRGRSSHGFLTYPPANFQAAHPWLEAVRIFLDAEFNALTGAEILGEGGEVLRSFTIMEIKRVEAEWIVKTIDYRDRVTGDKTRLSIRGATFGLPEDEFRFSPSELERPFPRIPRDQFSLF